MAKKKNGKQAEATAVLDIPVEFGGVGIGQKTARLGLKIDREVMAITKADEALCGRRCTGRVAMGGNNDSPGQGRFWDDLEDVIDATFDIHRFGVTPDNFTSGLTFNLGEIDIGMLAGFSKGKGRLQILGVADIPKDTVDEHEDDDDSQRELPGTLKSEGPWRDVPLDTLFEGAILKSLKKGGLSTMGELADYSASETLLIDLPGVGEAKAQQIEDRMLQFWRDNPQYGGGKSDE